MRNFLLTICFLLFAVTAFSQVPGYQGKKLSIYFSLNGFPALQGLNYRTDIATLDNTQDLSAWHLNLNTRQIFDIDYAVSRGGAVGLTLQFLRTGTTTPINETFIVPNGPITEGVGTYVNITSMAPGIYYKFFFYSSSGSIAPLGVYSQLEVLDFMNSAPQTRLYEVPLGVSSPVVSYGKVGSCIGITYSVGQQSIFFNRVILNFGIQLGVIPAYLSQIGNSVSTDDNGNGSTTGGPLTGTNSSLIESAVTARLAGMIFMNVYVGIGLIVF